MRLKSRPATGILIPATSDRVLGTVKTAGTKDEAGSKRRLQIPASIAVPQILFLRDLAVAFRRAAGNDVRDTASFYRAFLARRKSSKGALGEGTG